ncbi:MAG: AzlD domain-containing protein [Deinococcota bacterium]
MNFYVLIFLLGLIVFTMRYSFILVSDSLRLPAWLERALRFVPASVLAAIVSPAFVYPDSQLDISLTSPYLIAGVCACLTAWRSKNTLLTIVVGMAVMLTWRALFQGSS